MAEAQSTISPSSFASQEARRLELNRQRASQNQATSEETPDEETPERSSGRRAVRAPFQQDRTVRLRNADGTNVKVPNGALRNSNPKDPSQQEGYATSKTKLARIRNADGTTTKIPAGMRSGNQSGSSAALDQAMSRQSREQRFESLLRQERRRPDGNSSQAQRGEDRLSIRDTLKLAKNSAAPSGPGGIPMSEEGAKKMVGNALIKMSWSNLWLTFGHSVYVLDVLFFAGWASTYLRQYIPEVGMEWFPGELGKKMPKHALLPLKLGEIVGLSFLTILVLLMDVIMLVCVAFLLGLVIDGYHAYKALPLT